MSPAILREARGRFERAFRTHQGRLVKEPAAAGITEMEEANRYLREAYLPAYNAEFTQAPMEKGSAFVPLFGRDVTGILCEHHERVVGEDNWVSFAGKRLQVPPDPHQMPQVTVKVRAPRYPDGSPAIFHGPGRLADYDNWGRLQESIEACEVAT